MGGNAFDNVMPLSINELNTTWLSLIKKLSMANLTNVELVGGRPNANVLSDIDLAIDTRLSKSEIFQRLKRVFGHENVKLNGSNMVCIRYVTVEQKNVQVDVIYGRIEFLRWMHSAGSENLKGVFRNLLLNAVMREQAKYNGDTRKRYTLDTGVGLHYVNQKKNSDSEKWNTLDTTFISDDPDIITRLLFGEKYLAYDTQTFENLLSVIRNSKLTAKLASQIEKSFLDDVLKRTIKPNAFGSETSMMVEYLKKLLIGEINENINVVQVAS